MLRNPGRYYRFHTYTHQLSIFLVHRQKLQYRTDQLYTLQILTISAQILNVIMNHTIVMVV